MGDPSERSRSRTGRTVSLSVIVGTLLVPMSAVAALLLTGPSSTDSAAESTTSSIASQLVATQDATETTVAEAADLNAACGPAGMELVTLEQSGVITGVQQAALDALREICEQEGMPLPGKPAPEPITETVFVANDSSTATSPSPSLVDGDDHQEEEGEDEDNEDHEEHEDESEGHEEDEAEEFD